MAHQIDSPAAMPGQPAEDELQALHPEQKITLAGRQLTMREYGFVEGLRVRAQQRPFLDALHALLTRGGSEFTYEAIQDLLAEHHEAVRVMVAQAAGVEPEWVDGLSDTDGSDLLLLWWAVNSGFFLRRVFNRIHQDLMRIKLLRQTNQDGPTSSPSLSAPGITEETSPTIPSAS